MIAAVDLPAWWFMVVAVIGLAVSAVYHLLIGRRTVRRVTQLRRRQLGRPLRTRPDTAATMNANIDPTPCPTCGGDGLDASHEAALFYAHRGELSPCPDCDGSGTVPDVHIPVGVYGASAAPPTTPPPQWWVGRNRCGCVSGG